MESLGEFMANWSVLLAIALPAAGAGAGVMAYKLLANRAREDNVKAIQGAADGRHRAELAAIDEQTTLMRDALAAQTQHSLEGRDEILKRVSEISNIQQQSVRLIKESLELLKDFRGDHNDHDRRVTEKHAEILAAAKT